MYYMIEIIYGTRMVWAVPTEGKIMIAVLANPNRILEVNSVHNSIATTFKNVSLEDVLIVGYNWNREKILIV